MEATFDLDRNLAGDRKNGIRRGGLDGESGEIGAQGRVGEGNDIDVIFRPGFIDREGKTGPENVGRVNGWDVEG